MYSELGKIDESTIYRLEPGIYLVQLAGQLTVKGSNDINDLIHKDRPTGKRAVLYETTRAFKGYDSELRKLQQNRLLQGTTHIGIITTNPLLRMVTASIALTLRTVSGVPMSSYSTVESALEGARKALSHAREM